MESKRVQCFQELGGHKRPLKEQCHCNYDGRDCTGLRSFLGHTNLKSKVEENQSVSTQVLLFLVPISRGVVVRKRVNASEVLGTQPMPS